MKGMLGSGNKRKPDPTASSSSSSSSSASASAGPSGPKKMKSRRELLIDPANVKTATHHLASMTQALNRGENLFGATLESVGGPAEERGDETPASMAYFGAATAPLKYAVSKKDAPLCVTLMGPDDGKQGRW